MIFNLHFRDDDWCEYLFVYLLAICISSLVKYMFSSLVCLKNGVVGLLIVEFWEFFIYFGWQSMAYLFIPLTVSFVEQKFLIQWKVKVLVAQSCPTLCDPMDCSPPGSSVHGIFQARILEWVPLRSPCKMNMYSLKDHNTMNNHISRLRKRIYQHSRSPLWAPA